MVPEKKNILALAEELSVKGSYEELCQNKAIVDKVLAELTKTGKDAGLFGFE